MTNDLEGNGQEELFRDAEHLVVYRDADELIERIHWYLIHEEKRERIAAAGRQLVLQQHTYRDRVERILEDVSRPIMPAVHPPAVIAPADNRDPSYFAFPRPELLVLVPRTARRVLDVGCGAVCKGITMSRAAELDPSSAPLGEPALTATSELPAMAGAEPCCTDAEADRSYAVEEEAFRALPSKAAARTLFLGDGTDRLAPLLRERCPSGLVGVEADENRANASRELFDEVLVGDIERLPDFPQASFDIIVCALLSRVRDPWRLLRRIRTWLAPGGHLVVRVPNIRHHAVVRALLRGQWHEESAAATGPGNLRFFTRRELEKAFYRTAYRMQRIQGVPGAGHDRWRVEGRPGRVQTEGLDIDGLSQQDAEDFYSSHFLIEAEPSPDCSTPLTSIVILTHNQLDYTKPCVASILRYTDEPIELVFAERPTLSLTLSRKHEPLLPRWN